MSLLALTAQLLVSKLRLEVSHALPSLVVSVERTSIVVRAPYSTRECSGHTGKTTQKRYRGWQSHGRCETLINLVADRLRENKRPWRLGLFHDIGVGAHLDMVGFLYGDRGCCMAVYVYTMTTLPVRGGRL